MIRYFFQNKWFFFGFGFLIIYAGLCYLWLQQTTESYRLQLYESDDVVLQSDISQELHRTTEIKVSEAKESKFKVDSSTLIEKTAVTSDVIETDVDYNRKSLLIQNQKTETQNPRISPHGFGPYPEIPPDYPRQDLWHYPAFVTAEHELLLRVQVKLWKQGIRTVGGGMIDGRIYPNIPGTVYIKWENRMHNDGTKKRYVSRMYGDPHAGKILSDIINSKSELQESDIPREINVINSNDGGIDPYKFLNIRK